MHHRIPIAVLTITVLLAFTQSNAQEDLAAAAARVMDGRFRQNDFWLERLWGGYRNVKEHRVAAGVTDAAAEVVEVKFHAAYNAGDRAEARRLIHHAYALMRGWEWTPLEEYRDSLVLRSDSRVCDPNEPLIARIEQFYHSRYPADAPLRIEISLRPGNAPRRGDAVKTFRAFVSPEIQVDRPLMFAIDLRDVREGNYALSADVYAGQQPLRRMIVPISIVADLAAKRSEYERRLRNVKGHELGKASVRYPFDFALRIDLGERDHAGFDFRRNIDEAGELLAALERGVDPRLGTTGDQRRHYYFEEADEIMPYRQYVPTTYDGSRAFPLIVALHGGGGTENTMIGGPNSLMKRLAEQHGYIVVAPLGYRPLGGYGRDFSAMGMPSMMRDSRFSEMDVMNVLQIVRDEYNVDPKRIYLMGHSMGGNGTWRLGAEYAHIWAAMAPIASGQVTPDGVAQRYVTPIEAEDDALLAADGVSYPFERIEHIPVLVCAGAIDPRAPVENARAMVAAMKKRGMTYEYFEKPDGTHAMVQPSLPIVFDFFNRHAKSAP